MRKLLMAAALATFPAFLAVAEVPRVLNHQGMLTDETGLPLTGSYVMAFRLYEESAGGEAIWSETQLVAVENGVFNVYLGSATPLDDSLFLGQEMYLGVTVADDGEMIPRLRLGSVAYAFTANRNAAAAATWYLDGDSDGYGNPSVSTTAFIQPPGYVADSTDCDDGAPDIHPGAVEDCDGIDSDCDGNDANGVPAPPCVLSAGVCSGARMTCEDGDWIACSDVDYGPHYQPTEVACDGLDNDCDGAVDEDVDCDDGNPCTTDICFGASGCAHYPENAACDDGLECTADACGDGGCTHTLLPLYCLIGGVCYYEGEARPSAPCYICASYQPHTWTPAADGTPCADGNGTCQGGLCVTMKSRY